MGRPPRQPLAAVGREGGVALTRPGALPAVLRAPLETTGGRCYRHCDAPVRLRRVASALPGTWLVRACPAGVVSVTSYAEWSRRDPTKAVARVLRRWAVPASLVRAWDLRAATRHGPELGPRAERFVSRRRTSRKVRVVYWRVYPFRARDGTERRLFVCFRRSHPGPVFFGASPASKTWDCPACSRRGSGSRRSAPSAR